MTTHLYVRVSTDKQDDSIDLQRQVLTDYCKQRGLLGSQPQWWEDRAVSARLVNFADRPAAGMLTQQLQAGDVIVAKSLDRLFRNVADGVTTVERWREQGVSVRLVDQDGVSLDSSTATGWLVLVQLLTIAQFEALLTAERTTKCMANRRKNGKATSHAPYGQRIVDRDGERVLVLADAEQRLITALLSLREQGWSFRDCADRLNNDGYRTRKGGAWTYSALAKIARAQQR